MIGMTDFTDTSSSYVLLNAFTGTSINIDTWKHSACTIKTYHLTKINLKIHFNSIELVLTLPIPIPPKNAGIGPIPVQICTRIGAALTV